MIELPGDQGSRGLTEPLILQVQVAPAGRELTTLIDYEWLCRSSVKISAALEESCSILGFSSVESLMDGMMLSFLFGYPAQ